MSDADTMKKTGKHDWSRFDALTDEEVHAAALADPDAQPLTEERLARMKRVPRALSHSDRHAARLGAGAFGARPARARLSQRHRTRPGGRAPRSGSRPEARAAVIHSVGSRSCCPAAACHEAEWMLRTIPRRAPVFRVEW
jgi:hypothetical protein